MKKGAGKSKGSAFERWAAKQLSLWLTDGKDATQLIRSVLSGGWSARGANQVGDLAANGPMGEAFRKVFAVECKHHREIDLWDAWTIQDGGKWLRWWGKLLDEAVIAGLEPMLIMRANRKPDMVGLRHQLVRRIWSLMESDADTIPFVTFHQYNLTLVPLTSMLKGKIEWFLPGVTQI